MEISTESPLDAWRQGDTGAFRKIVALHQEYAFALAFRILCETEDARDVAQECFIRAWTHRANYRPEIKLTTWLYRIVVNLCYDRLRTRQRKERLFIRSKDIGEAPPGGATAYPDDTIDNRDLAARIAALARTLPERQRMVFTLRDLQDLTIGEVSAILGISEGSVRANLCYARAAIRSQLDRKG